MEAMIDVDLKPYIVAEVGGTVVDVDGAPTFRPDEPGRNNVVLARCLNKYIRVRYYRDKQKRSNAANAYLWSVVYVDVLRGLRELAEAAGELPVFTDEDDLHEALKWKFLREVVALVGAGGLERVPTTKVSRARFCQYVDNIKLWASGLHIYIREPHEPAPWEVSA